jgi:curli production assembly/transport component CsgG
LKTAIFSTAVTQGATSILIKALEDSNGLSIEEKYENLLQERNLIRSTRQEYKRCDPNVPQITLYSMRGFIRGWHYIV